MNEYLSSFKVANYTVAEGDEVRTFLPDLFSVFTFCTSVVSLDIFTYMK